MSVECFPLVGLVFHHVVDRLLASPLFLEGVPGLEEKIFGYFVVEDHYLRRVARAVDFSGIERLCVARTPDRPGGIPPIPPLKLQLNRLVQAFSEDLFQTADIEPASESDRQTLAQVVQQAGRLVGIKLRDVDRFWERFQQWLHPEPQTDPAPPKPTPVRVTFPSMKPAELIEGLKRVLVGLVHAIGHEDCRYGHTSDHEVCLGYLSSFGVDTAHHIITATVLDHGATHCSTPFEALYAQHQDHLRRARARPIPARGLGDSG